MVLSERISLSTASTARALRTNLDSSARQTPLTSPITILPGRFVPTEVTHLFRNQIEIQPFQPKEITAVELNAQLAKPFKDEGMELARKYSLQTISEGETKVWAYTSVIASVIGLAWGAVTGTITGFPLIAYTLLALNNLVFQSARLNEAKYDAKFPPLTDDEKGLARDEKAPKVAILIPAYHEPPAVLRKTLWSAALQKYTNREVVLLNDNDPKNKEQAGETAQITGIIGYINFSLSQGQSRVLNFQTTYKGTGPVVTKNECLGISQTALFLFDFLVSTNESLGPIEDLTDQVTRQRVFLDRAQELRNVAAEYVAKAEMGTPDVTREAADRIWQELGLALKTKVSQFERKTFSNLPHTKQKSTNINAFLSLDGQVWVSGINAEGKRIIVAADDPRAKTLTAAKRLSVARHDYFMIIDADTRVFPDYLEEGIPFMERPAFSDVSIFQSPTFSLPSKHTSQNLCAYEMNMTGLLEKGYAVSNHACWAGCNGILRRSMVENLTEPGVEEGSPYRKIVKDSTPIEDFETDVIYKTEHPEAVTVYASRPLCVLINPENFGETEIQRNRWSNGPLVLLKHILQFGQNLARGVFYNRVFRFFGYSINIAIILGTVTGAGVTAINPILHLFFLTGFLAYFRPLQKRGFKFIDAQLALVYNFLLAPTYIKGTLSTIRQLITGQKSDFKRTPKDGVRQRISLATAFFAVASLGLLIRQAMPALAELIVNGKVVFAPMLVYMIGLHTYTIQKVIGIRNLIADSAANLKQKLHLA